MGRGGDGNLQIGGCLESKEEDKTRQKHISNTLTIQFRLSLIENREVNLYLFF